MLGRRGLQTKLPFQLERACVGILRPVLDYVYFFSTSRLVFVRRCGFVLLLPALSRPSSCGPVALLHCPSVPAVSFLFVGVASFRSRPPYRVRRPVARGLTTLSLRTGRLVFVRRCGFVSLLPALSRPSSCGPVALLSCPCVPPIFSLVVSRPPVIFYILCNSV